MKSHETEKALAFSLKKKGAVRLPRKRNISVPLKLEDELHCELHIAATGFLRRYAANVACWSEAGVDLVLEG